MRRLTPAEIEAYDLVSPQIARRVQVQRTPLLTPGCSGLTIGRLVLIRNSHYTSSSHDPHLQERATAAEGNVSARQALLAHELVHVEQYARIGVRRFLWRYLREYFGNLLRLRSHKQAYRAISFEVEARTATAAWSTRQQSNSDH